VMGVVGVPIVIPYVEVACHDNSVV